MFLKSSIKKLFSINRIETNKEKNVPETEGYVVSVPLEEIRTFVPNKMLKDIFHPNKVHFSTIQEFIWTGEWDNKALSIDTHYVSYSKSYKSIFQIFRDNSHYTETDEYQDKYKAIKMGESTARGDSVDELNHYFESLIKLKKSIEKDGYKSQKEIGGEKYDEIGVFIGRNGEIIKAEDKFCGTHRFAIAKYLQLKSVPVCILAVHWEWAKNNKYLIDDISNLELYLNSKK